jgi:hypothetical protein
MFFNPDPFRFCDEPEGSAKRTRRLDEVNRISNYGFGLKFHFLF